VKGATTMSETILHTGAPSGAPLGRGRTARLDAFHRSTAAMNERLRWRADATGVLHLARQLEDLDAKLYDTLFPGAKAAQLIPMKTNIDIGAETATYQFGDISGRPRPATAPQGRDYPLIEVTGGSETITLGSWNAGYAYSVQELRRGAMSGMALDTAKANATRKVFGLNFELVMCSGSSEYGFKGFANNASVSLVSAITGTWSSAAALQMIADVAKGIRAIKIDSKGAHVCNLVALPPSLMALLEITLVANTAVTAIEHLRKTYPSIDFEEWALLETAGAASVARIVFAERGPDNYQGVNVVEFESFAPELEGMTYVVPCHQRLGGVLVRYPLSIRYMDGC
jgi:hypothetical protein